MEYAQIKKCNQKYFNYCNRCHKYKYEEMKNADIIFYQIKLSFVLDKVFHGNIDSAFQEIITKSEIQPFSDGNIIDDGGIKRSGWITNSMDIENYWFKVNNLITVQDIIMNRSSYLEFINENFELLEERSINFCNKCWLSGKKIKLD